VNVPITHPNYIGVILRDFRIAAGLTQAGAARAAGVTRNQMWEVESGKHSPRLATIVSIAGVAGYDLVFVKRRPQRLSAQTLPTGSIVATESRVWIKRSNEKRHPVGTPFHETWWIEATTYAIAVPDREIQQMVNAGDVEVLRVGAGEKS
jgi:transcriptional regulator with XRE-family HTH domain